MGEWVGTYPPHPPLEGEGGRGRDHAARGARGAAKIPIVNLPLLGGSRTNFINNIIHKFIMRTIKISVVKMFRIHVPAYINFFPNLVIYRCVT